MYHLIDEEGDYDFGDAVIYIFFYYIKVGDDQILDHVSFRLFPLGWSLGNPDNIRYLWECSFWVIGIEVKILIVIIINQWVLTAGLGYGFQLIIGLEGLLFPLVHHV